MEGKSSRAWAFLLLTYTCFGVLRLMLSDCVQEFILAQTLESSIPFLHGKRRQLYSIHIPFVLSA